MTAMFFGWRVIILCFLLLDGVPNSSTGAPGQFPNSLIQPGSLFPAKANDPKVQRAARLGVYKYNNSSNDIFLFKESRINKATIQIVKGVKYRLNVDICRTVCRKRIPDPNLDRCDFQKNKMLQKVYVQLLCTVLRNQGEIHMRFRSLAYSLAAESPDPSHVLPLTDI